MAKGVTSADKANVQDKKKTAWRGISRRVGRPTSMSSQESRVTNGSSDNESALSVNITRIQSDDSSDSSDSEVEVGPPSPIEEDSPEESPVLSPVHTATRAAVGGEARSVEQTMTGDDSDSVPTPKAGTRSRASSNAASEVFEDAYDEQDGDDYYDHPVQRMTFEDLSRQQTTNISMILPALKGSEVALDERAATDSDSDEGESAVRPARPVYDASTRSKTFQAKQLVNNQSAEDLAAEIEALEIASLPIASLSHSPSGVAHHPIRGNVAEVGIYSVPSPAVPPPAEEAAKTRSVGEADAEAGTKAVASSGADTKSSTSTQANTEDTTIVDKVETVTGSIETQTLAVAESPVAGQRREPEVAAVPKAEPKVESKAEPKAEPKAVPKVEPKKVDTQHTQQSTVSPPVVVQNETQVREQATTLAEINGALERAVSHATDRKDDANGTNQVKSNALTLDQLDMEMIDDDSASGRESSDIEVYGQGTDDLHFTDVDIAPNTRPIQTNGDSASTTNQVNGTSAVPTMGHSDATSPKVEHSTREAHKSQEEPKQQNNQPVAGRPLQRMDSQDPYALEDPIDGETFTGNVIAIQNLDTKAIPINNLTAREQEEADEPVREAMQHLFSNRFMKAKAIFETKANIDPLYALGLGAMAFIKAIMTYSELDVEAAMTALSTSYTIAKTQIDATTVKRSFKETFSHFFTTLRTNSNTGLPSAPPIAPSSFSKHGNTKNAPQFVPNGVLRAYVIKAESSLLMCMLQMTQESVVGYLKCGLNLRRAYTNYALAWQEYKRMGQAYTKHMDRDTVSAIQFGIGSVHLLLSSLPAKVLKIFSALGWKSDRQLGFALLKLCMEGKGIRAPLASLMLLSYYTILTSFAPQLYSKEMLPYAVECLLETQKSYPSSCFFLYFAARIARVAQNLPLSTQSFSFALDSSRGEWVEVAMKHIATYETGWNNSLQLDWAGAAGCFEQLRKEKYWSPIFCTYFLGACHEMQGNRTECILAFAHIPDMAKEKTTKTYLESYVVKKVEFFQRSGYQDMDMNLPALELLLLWNAFAQMEPEALEGCLQRVDKALNVIYDRERVEYNLRLQELVPSTTLPDFYDQRAVLLLIKASVLNALGRHSDSIAHVNWILDHKELITVESWVLPFTYWEAGVTSWGLGNHAKSRKLWEQAMACSKYDFEYRLAVRLSLALNKCDEMGVHHIDDKEAKGPSTDGRKKMPAGRT